MWLQHQEQAQFHAIHLVRVMIKLRPDWLPMQLLEVLRARWGSQQRFRRWACHGALSRLSSCCMHHQAPICAWTCHMQPHSILLALMLDRLSMLPLSGFRKAGRMAVAVW